MAIHRITASTVRVQCRSCQAETDHLLVDLRAAHRAIKFPTCPVCQKSSLMANVIAGAITKEGAAAVMQAWNKALHQKLVADGHTVEGFNPESVDADLYEGALVWPEGDAVVEFLPAM